VRFYVEQRKKETSGKYCELGERLSEIRVAQNNIDCQQKPDQGEPGHRLKITV